MGTLVTVRFLEKGLGVDDVLIVVNTSLLGVRGLKRQGSARKAGDPKPAW